MTIPIYPVAVSSRGHCIKQVAAVTFCLSLLAALTTLAHSDELDDYVRLQMAKRNITGLSLAVMQNGKIVRAQGYGVIEKGSRAKVTNTTLFQAGSISKSVAAVGALRLLEQGKVSLDEDVNARLRSWHVPQNEFTKEQKVTLRRILSHSAGLTVHGFPGYAVDEPKPTLVQILDGAPPTNTPPIRVETVPGTKWNYSGGGYTIMQQLVLDVTGRSFPDYMGETVLVPLGMAHSTYEQPLPNEKARQTATGVYPDGSLVKGRWHVYPEMAAAGLWTTPSDLLRFAMGVQQSYAGKPGSILTQDTARQMLTDQKHGDGLGVFLQGKGGSLRFTHSGRDEAFDADLMATASTRQGVVVMINTNEDSGLQDRIVKLVARLYHWPDPPANVTAKQPLIELATKELEPLTGYYEFQSAPLIIAIKKGKLVASLGSSLIDELQPESATSFFMPDGETEVSFETDTTGSVSAMTWSAPDGQTLRLARLASVVHGAAHNRPDPDSSRTARVQAFLAAAAKGGDAMQSNAGVTPGAQKELGRGEPKLSGIQITTFYGEHEITGSNVERHGGKVARVLSYGFTSGNTKQAVLVYVTAENQFTDYDIVAQ